MDFKNSDLVLELGAGDNPMKSSPNWHLHDIRWLPGLTYVFDLERMFPIPGESYDGVVARYCLEHLSWRHTRHCVGEIFRILKPGGKAIIITANILEQCKAFVRICEIGTPREFQDMVCGIFGSQDYLFNTHKSGLSPNYADYLFRQAGFYEVRVEPIITWAGPTDMTITATKSKAVIE